MFMSFKLFHEPHKSVCVWSKQFVLYSVPKWIWGTKCVPFMTWVSFTLISLTNRSDIHIILHTIINTLISALWMKGLYYCYHSQKAPSVRPESGVDADIVSKNACNISPEKSSAHNSRKFHKTSQETVQELQARPKSNSCMICDSSIEHKDSVMTFPKDQV